MKNKATRVKKEKLEPEHIFLDIAPDHASFISKGPNNIGHPKRTLVWEFIVATLFHLVAVASLSGVSVLILYLQVATGGYGYLVVVVTSSVVGMALVFLSVRLINKRRKADWDAIIRRVRAKEKNLFEMLDVDFGRITRTKRA